MLKFERDAKEREGLMKKELEASSVERLTLKKQLEAGGVERFALKKELAVDSVERVSLKKELHQTKDEIIHLKGVISEQKSKVFVLENRLNYLQTQHDIETEDLGIQLEDLRNELGLAHKEKNQACVDLKNRSKQLESNDATPVVRQSSASNCEASAKTPVSNVKSSLRSRSTSASFNTPNPRFLFTLAVKLSKLLKAFKYQQGFTLHTHAAKSARIRYAVLQRAGPVCSSHVMN